MINASAGIRVDTVRDVRRHMSAGGSESLDRFALVVVAFADVSDPNGDEDGFADTNEAVDLLVTISNKSIDAYTNVVVTLTSEDRKIDCISNPSIVAGNLSGNSDLVLPEAFHLHVNAVADRDGPTVTCVNPGTGGACSNLVQAPGGCTADADCRLTPLQDYSALLRVAISSNQFAEYWARPQAIVLDLDLDSTYGAAPTTTFVEGFEAGFGSFMFQNLDTDKASNSASDGYRCQYNDPDNPDSSSYANPYCYLGFASGQPSANDWHVHTSIQPDGGRAYAGLRSLHYGKHVNGQDTYAFSQMDAIRTKAAIPLAARVCRDDPAPDKRACTTGADCLSVGGGPCVGARPVLTLKQQVAMVGTRLLGYVLDRAVVAIQRSGSSVWVKSYPFENVYDNRPYPFFSDCSFDPIDDGSNEDQLFEPYYPSLPAGPSSTCFPEFNFNYQGQTDGAYAPGSVGDASDGPGLAGSLGPGTWVEARFDLSRFRGRSVRVRFLATSVKDEDADTWESVFHWNPTPGDDGWYVDDVRITQTLGTITPTVTNDTRDNSGLPGDSDGDAAADLCDCAPLDPTLFAAPGEVGSLMVEANRTTITWTSLASSSGSATVHDVLRGEIDELPVGTGVSEACIAPGVSDASAEDPTRPPSGRGFYYLVRGRNLCGVGSYGLATGGVDRTSQTCP